MIFFETLSGNRIPEHRLYYITRTARERFIATWESDQGPAKEELLVDPEKMSGQVIPAAPGYYTLHPVENQKGDPDFDHILTFPVIAWRINGPIIEPVSVGPTNPGWTVLAPDGRVYDQDVIYNSVQDWGKDRNGLCTHSETDF